MASPHFYPSRKWESLFLAKFETRCDKFLHSALCCLRSRLINRYGTAVQDVLQLFPLPGSQSIGPADAVAFQSE
jgi:hypothetical protein